ncbi:hypothetical protein [Paraburkholderia sp. BL6665CI2N2]|uniref:hypothetical protein n=1 Tax=Paraburkholderia sp. BL6665CI2N2 TaxID=1938806 RepID=UPI0014170A54|nr:hypothetical protein [Paraburkholderia sp. BL6665CI2N2]
MFGSIFGRPLDSVPVIDLPRRTRHSRSVATNRPRTAHDFQMIAKATAKRERKGRKLVRDAIRAAEGVRWQKRMVAARAEARRISAAVNAEALAVYRELEAEQLGLNG